MCIINVICRLVVGHQALFCLRNYKFKGNYKSDLCIKLYFLKPILHICVKIMVLLSTDGNTQNVDSKNTHIQPCLYNVLLPF